MIVDHNFNPACPFCVFEDVIGDSTATCVECERVFDLGDENDAGDWFYGHDCEAP